MVLILVIVLPVVIIVSGGVLAAVIGAVLRDNGEKSHPGSELIATNK
jgi:hypothetical protein